MGDESLLIQCGLLLREGQHDIRAVITASPAVETWALGEGLHVYTPDAYASGLLDDITYDWFFSIANLRIVPDRIWRRARAGAANFHDGPLPRYAGLNAPAWAILAGETDYAVTWHLFGDGIDDGDILVQGPITIEPEDTALTLNTKCFEAGIQSFATLIHEIERGDLPRLTQSSGERTYFAKGRRPPHGATIDVAGTAAAADRLIRALSFGQGYANPLALPKIATRHGAFNLIEARVETGAPSSAAGRVLDVDADGARIALKDGILTVVRLSDTAGNAVDPARVLTAGEQLDLADSETLTRLDGVIRVLARGEDFFADLIRRCEAAVLPGAGRAEPGAVADVAAVADVTLADLTGLEAVAAAIGYFASLQQSAVSVLWSDDQLWSLAETWRGYVSPVVPLTIGAAADTIVHSFSRAVAEEIGRIKDGKGYAGDLVSRLAGVENVRSDIGVFLADHPASGVLLPHTAVTVAVPAQGGPARLIYDRSLLSEKDAALLAQRLSAFAGTFAHKDSGKLFELPLMAPAELKAAIVDANDTQRPYDRHALVHQLIARQARRTPDAVALVSDGVEVSYGELDRRSDRVAAALRAAGAGPDVLVGLYMARSADLVIGALGILKSGAAYVPLDPTYPADRIAFMIEDSKCPLLVTTPDLKDAVPGSGPRVLLIEAALDSPDQASPEANQSADTLAYVIYTSGSTGRPKGVMVEHRNVANFFAGMDDRIPVASGTQPVWLAVTSLSFDISVLELFWTLTRGFKVVIYSDTPTVAAAAKRRQRLRSPGGMDFSLFYWGNDDAPGPLKYQLLLEGAKFADSRGFCAVWTPERHFHAFGGPYPNPAVTGAAVAAVTRNMDIRAGSCVLPLHHVARVAEEWAVIDNLSNGRAGIAVAAGWMPEDFLLRPENAPPNNKTAMLEGLETLRRLWRGEAVSFEAPGGKIVPVVTQPRPVQRELPVWVTTAGNPDTYREAARHGANVLTHLLGQSISEVADKVRVYRETLVACGRNPADFKVTLMLHTLLGADREEVRDMARGPMKSYLMSAAALIKQYAWAFPAFKRPQGISNPNEVDLQSLDREELDAIIEFAFLRYFDDSGLFGTVEDALKRVEEIKAIGVDEIACLIDFGAPRQSVLRALEPLAEVVAAVNSGSAAVREEDESIGGLIRRYGVSHLQCTPSMAAMILSDDDDRAALSGLQHLFIGGEAFHGALLSDLRKATSATVANMYGPTETTIWSATSPAEPTEGTVPLGTPIANTQLYILDAALRPLPDGAAGELFIGGDGVTRGYLNRPELTLERFVASPFIDGGRLYRTGDLVRRGAGGTLEFLGRVDFQVKVRGYRIELGEIEACLNKHPGVAETVVVAREDKPGDLRIVAYVRQSGERVADEALRDHVKAELSDYMVPSHFVAIDRFPLTPNAKIDRKALPRPGEHQRAAVSAIEFIAPTDEVEIRIADAFKRALGVERISTLDNFFAIGGHSLLAVQVHRELKKSVASNLSITDLYRFPTVGGLAAHILDRGQASKDLDRVAQRAAMRRNAITARRPAQRT